MDNMNYLVPAFKESLFNESLVDVVTDISEIGIDSILSEGLLKDLPIFSVLIGSVRTVKSIQERNMLRNTAIFLDTINSKKIETEKLNQYKAKQQDEKVAEKNKKYTPKKYRSEE